MKGLLKFLLGIIVGVIGVTIYQIYGKPTLPSEDNLHDEMTNFATKAITEDVINKMAANSLDDMDDTQEIKIHEEPSAATLKEWEKESEG